ncbi:hypothetical protein [Microbacterium shaanxiense]
MLAGSWLLSGSENWAWGSDALLNVGSAILLFAPLLLLTEWLLERRVRDIEEDAEETRQVVRQTQREVGEAQARISELIDYNTAEGREEAARQLDEVVREAMFKEHNDFDALYASLAGEQNITPFAHALRSGIDRKLISKTGVRVELLYSELHLRFELRDDNEIDLHIESDNGEILATVQWRAGRTIAEVLTDVSTIASGLPGFDGMDKFFAGQTPRQLGETLMYAARFSPQMTGSYDIYKVMEITGEGWVIVERGLVPKSARPYMIDFDGAAPIDWDEHILNKPWPESPYFPTTMRWAGEMRNRRLSLP